MFTNHPKIMLFFTLIFFISSISFLRTAYTILQNSKRVNDLAGEVSALKMRKEELNKEIEYQKTDEYLEYVARNNLNLIKPGERVYAPDEKLRKQISKKSVLGLQSETPADFGTYKKNLYLWLELIL